MIPWIPCAFSRCFPSTHTPLHSCEWRGSLRAQWVGPGMGPWPQGLNLLRTLSSKTCSPGGNTSHPGTICGFNLGLAKPQLLCSQDSNNPGSVCSQMRRAPPPGSKVTAALPPACPLGSPDICSLLATSPLTHRPPWAFSLLLTFLVLVGSSQTSAG